MIDYKDWRIENEPTLKDKFISENYEEYLEFTIREYEQQKKWCIKQLFQTFVKYAKENYILKKTIQGTTNM